MDLRKAKQSELKFALKEINERPRKTLNWKSPNEYINELSCAAPYEADRNISIINLGDAANDFAIQLGIVAIQNDKYVCNALNDSGELLHK